MAGMTRGEGRKVSLFRKETGEHSQSLESIRRIQPDCWFLSHQPLRHTCRAVLFDIRLISRDVRLAPAGEIAGGRWFLRPTFAHLAISEAEFDTVRIGERQPRRKPPE